MDFSVVRRVIYFDANSTSRLRPYLSEPINSLFFSSESKLGNPSSIHTKGRVARAILRDSRASIKSFFFGDKDNSKIIFTSGGTEACNLLIDIFLGNNLDCSNTQVISSSIEHPAILEKIISKERQGLKVSWIKPRNGVYLSPEDFLKELQSKTSLVVLMLANNETGAIFDVAQTAKILRAENYFGPIVCDATQAVCKAKIDFNYLFESGINAFSFSGHKFGALTGCGAVVINTKYENACFSLTPSIVGGPQEEKLRAGTENLISIFSVAEVLKNEKDRIEEEIDKVSKCRELLWERLSDSAIGEKFQRITPSNEENILSNTLLLRVKGIRADDLVVALDLAGICVSIGSACSSGRQEVSHVLSEIGLNSKESKEVFRISLDWDIVEETIEKASKIILEVVNYSLQQNARGRDDE